MRVLVLLLIAVVYRQSSSSAQTYNFRHYNEENGLDRQYVYSIAQAGNGILYIATGEDVISFNGYTFSEVFNAQRAERFIVSLLCDSRNILWMGQQQRGLSYLRNGKVFALTAPGLENVKITQIVEGPDKQIWFSTGGAGVWIVDSLYRLKQVISEPAFVSDLAIDEDGYLVTGGANGLMVTQITPSGISSAEKKISGFNNDEFVQQILPGKKGFWVLTGAGISYIERGKQAGVYKVTMDGGSVPALNRPEASCLGVDLDGNLWIGTAGNGLTLVEFMSAGGNNKSFARNIGRAGGFPADNVKRIFRDREGNMWFGCFGEGLVQKPRLRFSYYSEKEGLPDPNVTAVLALHDTDIWLGGNNGLSHFHQAENRWTTYPTTAGLPVSAIARDSSGLLWLGTTGEGLFSFNALTSELQPVGRNEGADIQHVNALAIYDNKLFVCSSNGLFIFSDPQHYEWLRTNEGLLHNNVKQVFRDSKSRLWVASHGAPPYYIKDRQVHPLKNAGGLQSYNVNAYAEDKSGHIWMASEGDGVFELSDTAFAQYKAGDGLLSDYCNGVCVNVNGAVWVTHRSGISEKRNRGTGFRNYSSKNGLVHYRCNRNAVSCDNEGNVWFGTVSGLVQYDVSQLSQQRVLPQTEVLKVTVGQEKFEPHEYIILPYGHYTVRFDYISVSLADPEGTSYRYRLLDADTTWKYTDQRFVEFPQLSDGKYVFEVAALNSDNGWHEPGKATVTFKIREPVWRTLWFYILLLLAVIATTYTIIQLRTRAFRKRQMLLELKVKQKTFLLQREKDAVEAIKLVVEQKNKDITDSIMYAKKIQDSILPPDELLQNLFGDNYFVLFRPKDIVSGDFYWAASLKVNENNKIPLALAAVIDCTGHGVPGAFLSIMANDFLRQSIIDTQVNMPHHVLNFLNEKISSHLNQTAKSKIRDGMDLALIGIDYSKKMLYFSGANNPIYIFRKTGTELDMVILTATKQAIGLVSEETVPYTIREYRLQPGDIIYMFSDGYADQFGGDQNKKFTYKRFREVLAEAWELPMHEQKELLARRFAEWRGNEQQTDDVCVMGIRIT